MSEAIIIALIGIVPSISVAIVTIVSNNTMIQKRLESLENVADEYRHYEIDIQELRHSIAECQSYYLQLGEHIYKLEQKKHGKGRINI